jgi:AbrB family looped-hinge helix DNA binding protein
MEQFDGVITSKGQLVIPAKLRRVFRIGQGTRVRFARIHGGIAIYPEHEADIDHYRGILADLNLPSDIEHDADREVR